MARSSLPIVPSTVETAPAGDRPASRPPWPGARHLRRVRTAIALAVLAPAVLMFVDFGRILPAAVAPAVSGMQLVPAALRVPAIAAVVTLAVLALVTLLGGRVYCSTLCPLGTLQDLVIRLGDRRSKRGRFRFRYLAPRRWLHLGVAAAAVALAALGFLLALDLLEPYSAFGRILSALVRPVVAWIVNGVSRILATQHVYAVQPVLAPPLSWPAVAVALASLAGIAALSLWRGRLFCNLLCPAGALLRLASRRPALRVHLDEACCDGCGVCEKSCKAGCIDAGRRHVDADACVGCFVCLDVCRKDGVRYGLPQARAPRAAAPDAPADAGRRAVLRATALAPAAFVAPAPARAEATDPRDARLPITPPGSLARDHFVDHCTACHLCVAACPSQVLRPALLEYGLAGLLQPHLVFDAGACVHDCRRCGEVCPAGAIHELPLAEKQLAQIGRARFVKDECVVVTKKKACGACGEHCPTKAITMVPYPGGEGNLRIPEVNEEACIGCGACEHPCPTQPRKAIWVEARAAHGVAKPIRQAPLERPAADADFPF